MNESGKYPLSVIKAHKQTMLWDCIVYCMYYCFTSRLTQILGSLVKAIELAEKREWVWGETPLESMEKVLIVSQSGIVKP
jgi:hypothetical protein